MPKKLTEAVQNALHYKEGASVSDGNIVVGKSDRQIAVAFNNTTHNQNQLLLLELADAHTIHTLLGAALRTEHAVVPAGKLTPDEALALGKLLVKLHNTINAERHGRYGVTMEKALCLNTFDCLLTHGDNNELKAIRRGFAKGGAQ